MRILLAIGVAMFIAAMAFPSSSAFAQKGSTKVAATCSAGRITCLDWCKKYYGSGPGCLTGYRGSCDKMSNGNNTCVLDRPNLRN